MKATSFLATFAIAFALIAPGGARAEERVEIPLILDLEDAGLVTVAPQDPPEETRVEGADLFQALLPVATPQTQTRLWNAIRDGFVSLKELNALGIEARLDMETLTLRISLGPESRKPKDISLREGATARSSAVPPARASAALNVYGSRSLWHDDPDADASANGARADLSGFFTTPLGAVLEAEGGYNEFEPDAWRRGDLRVVYDDSPGLLRFTAGDLRFSAAGFRSYVPLGGIGVTRELAIDPDLVNYPTSNRRIQLRNPSRVDVVVNGAIVRTLRLPAGQFDIREIPLLGRLNEIELLITDIYGRTESVRFPFIAASELLRPGFHQFSYNLGLPSAPRGGRYDYDEDRVTFSGWHRVGWTDRFTFGGFAQGHRRQAILGVEALAVNAWGLFRLEVAASRVAMSDSTDGAGRFAYRSFQEERGKGPFGWGMQLETRGRRFAQLGELAPFNAFSHRADFFVDTRVSDRVTVTLGAFKDWPHPGLPLGFGSALGAYLNTSASLNDRWQLGADVSATDDSAVRRERRAFVTLRWRDPSRPLIAAVSADTRDATRRAELAFSGARARADANVATARNADAANANVSAFFQRAQLGYGLAASETRAGAGGTRSAVSVFQVGGALTYADGRFALSRPVAESFALVGDGSEAWQRGILVNPSETVYAGRIDGWGPAAVADLQSYRAREIFVDTTPLQTGLTLERERFLVIPGYRSGYHLPLKLHSVVILAGRVVDPDGSPLLLLAGEILAADAAENATKNGPPSEPIEFFTDREGRFEIEGLNPGEYMLRTYSDKWAPARFTLDANARGVISIGDLRLRKANE